jgi:serine/threonine-protein kinase HipA
MTILDVYLEATPYPIGKLSATDEGVMAFTYTTDQLPHPISASLPIVEEAYGDVVARGFFSNLLFENEMRDQVMQRHGISEGDIVGLLSHLGADCPGSISCVPEGAPPGKRPGSLNLDYDALDGSPHLPEDLSAVTEQLPVIGSLAEIMTSLRDHRRVPKNTNDPSPLAGVQGKIALTRMADGRLGLPKANSGAPTTHILKVPRANAMSSVMREHLATRLMAGAQKHAVAETCVLGEGDLQGLLVTRFDRRLEDVHVHRIHQEDFCQALGFGHTLKYERNGSAGRAFTAAAIGQILSGTRIPAQARQAFFEITLANLVLGNSDNHAKNHALLYTSAKPDLAPAYDIDPVLLDDVTHEMSFCIGEARIADDVTQDDLNLFTRALGARGFSTAQRQRVATIIQSLHDAAETLPRPIGKGLCDVIRQQSHHLSVNMGLGLDILEFDNVPVNRL